jgi:hypothetical protein
MIVLDVFDYIRLDFIYSVPSIADGFVYDVSTF